MNFIFGFQKPRNAVFAKRGFFGYTLHINYS